MKHLLLIVSMLILLCSCQSNYKNYRIKHIEQVDSYPSVNYNDSLYGIVNKTGLRYKYHITLSTKHGDTTIVKPSNQPLDTNELIGKYILI